MKRSSVWWGLCVSAAMSGCGATAVVTDITTIREGVKFNGVPFRVLRTAEVDLWRLDDSEVAFQRVPIAGTSRYLLPDDRQLLSVGYQGRLFSDSKMVVSFHKNGSIASYTLTDTNTTKDSVDAAAGLLGKEAERVAAKAGATKSQFEFEQLVRGAKRESDKEADSSQVAVIEALADAEIKISVLEAAEQEFVANPASKEAAAALKKAQQDARIAKVKANIASRRVGRTEPYPGAD